MVAAYCFARSNDRWHAWMMNHRVFGKFLREWASHRVFPRKAKWMMVITMDMSLIMLWMTTQNFWLVFGVGVCMLLVSAWAWRFPDSLEQAQQREQKGESLGWFGRW